MDVKSQASEDTLPERGSRRPGYGSLRRKRAPGGSSEWVGEVLGEWQAQEIRSARSFPECRGLSTEQLEDIYQETTVALLSRPYRTEEHLRNALRTGLKHRALNLHRDERRRGQILAYSAPGMHVMAEASAGQDAPELAAIVQQDRSIVSEFLTELSAIEQRVFWLLAEGMQYRAIAPVLGIEVNVARNASRACERKRERFQLLYDTGRLCGFRAATILALQSGEATSEELAERAFAHLDSCAHCRAEHKTNARRLRHRFQGQAAALLPVPVLLGHVGWLVRFDVRLRTLLHRFAPDGVPVGPGGVRERAAALIAGGGAAAKLAATVATVVVVGGTIGATHVLDSGTSERHRHVTARHASLTQQASAIPSPLSSPPIVEQAATPRHQASRAKRGGGRAAPRRTASSGHLVSSGQSLGQREPGGFAYLGVPSSTPPSAPSAPAQIASQSGGGPFSP
jgi:RNA polymerase sigma factor (sigma-70 family)